MSYLSLMLSHNPHGYWRLGETSGTVAEDASPNNRDGTYSGVGLGVTGLLTASGDTDKAGDFTGGSYVAVPYAAWADAIPMTVVARVKADNVSSYKNIINKDGTVTRGWNLYVKNGKLTVFNVGGVGNEFSGATTLSTGVEYSVAMTFDGTTTRLYLNGVLDGSLVAAPSNPQAGLSIGASFAGTGTRTLGWDGKLDEVAFLGTALSAAQLLALHVAATTASPPSAPTGLSVDPGLTTLDLSWSAVTSATGYEARIDGGTPIDVSTALGCLFTGLEPSSTHTLEVRAYNGAGSSSWSSISGTTDDLAPPTGLVVISADDDSITFGWDTHPDAEGFEVRIDGGTPIDVGLTTLHVFEGLDPFTMYELEVRAYLSLAFSDWASLDGDTDPEAPPTGEYTVTLKVGDHEWIITHEDVLDPDEPIQVLDGLTLEWEIPESDPWPTQPAPVLASVGFYTADVANLADVAIGTPMGADLEDGDGNVFATFRGRVTQEQATPIKRKAGLRMLYKLNGADYTVDLDEEPVTIAVAWPAESADARFVRIVELAATVGITLVAPADTGSAAFEELAEGATTVGALVRDHLAQIAIDSDYGPVRYIVTPVVIDYVLDRFECVLVERTIDAVNLPGVFAIVGGLFTLVFPDTHADGVVEAGDVRLDVTWSRLKYRAANRVTVAGSVVTAEASRPGPPVRLNMSTTLTDQPAADRMAELYLPDVDEALGWVADAFQFLAHREQGALIPSWFPNHRDDPGETSVYVMPIAVTGIPPAMNLAGDLGVYAGQLSSVALRLEKRKILVDFAQRRQMPLGVGDDGASWDWAQAEFPTVDWDDIDPDLSWYEARLGKAI